MKSTLLTSIFGTLVCLLFANSAVRAQGVGASGDIRGTVTDPAGRVIPKVAIVAEDAGKGIRRTAVTDENGQFEITGLQPGTYSITARISGFQSEIIKDVSVSVGQTVILDLPMKISTGSDVVEVTTELPVVETERSHQADTVTEQLVTTLPIDRRDYLTFTLLMPGVSDSTRMASNQDFRVKQTPQSGLSFYGSNGRGNSVTVDGGEANDDSGGVRLNLSQEALQEFQINRSNYTAELGGASGATINIVSKSGSNQVHGSLYGFFRNDALDAADPFAINQALQPGQVFNPLAPDLQGTNVKNSLSRQQFGGTIGFPIKKDKTFLFAAFEGLRQDAQNAVPLISSTSIFRPNTGQGAIFAGLTAEGNGTSVPCLSGPVGAAVAAKLPPPFTNMKTLPAAVCASVLGGALTLNPATSPLSAYLINQFESNGGVFPYNTHRYQASGRLDHHFNDANQVFLRYNYSRDLEESPDVTSLTGFTRGSSIHNYDHTIQGAWYHQFSQFTQNALYVQWNYDNFDVIPNVPGQAGLDIPGFANLGTQIFLPSLTIMRRPSVADDFTMIRGHHTLKFGGLELLRGNHSESHTFFPGRFVFGSLPGALLSPCLANPTGPITGNPSTTGCALQPPAGGQLNPAGINSIQSGAFGLPQFYQQGFDNPVYDYPRNFAAFYWQDSWKIIPNFTLNYGLRYELDSQYGPLKADKDNFAPRVSFAWDPFKNHKTVIRGGYGIFYSQIYGQIGDVVQTLGLVNGFRQIAQIFVPLTGAPGNPSLTSAAIFQTLFAQGKIQCTTPAPGNAACITPADLTQFGIAVTHTGPVPPLTVIFSGQPNYQNPYAQQASLGIEREIITGFSVAVSGIYSHTLRLPVAIDINALPAPTSTATLANGNTVTYRNWGGPGCAGALILNCFVNPLLLQADQYSSQASALFEGGIIEAKKRFSNNFTLLGNYTYSKAFDTSTDFNSDFGPQDNTSLSAERGLSDFDQRHKFVVAAVIDSPWKNKIASGFQLAPIVRYNSGHPFNLLAGADVNGDRHSTNDRPIGAGRNTGLGPSYTAFDMRLSYLFKLREKASLQFVAEGFNIANRTNFASVNNVVGPGFGLPLTAGGAGSTTFNVKGTSAVSPSLPLGFTSAFPKREIQLGLRLTF